MKTSAKFNFVKNVNKVLLFISLLSASVVSQAQVNLNNLNPYTQNFDGLPQSGAFVDNSTIPGWYVALGGSRNISGGNGSNTTTGIRSFGSDSDRSLGGVTNGTTGDIFYSLKIKNTTGSDINSFIVSYNLEEWRGMQKEPFEIFGYILWYTSVYGNMSFEYQIGNGTWNPVADLNMTGKVAGGNDADLPADGNANKTTLNAVIKLASALGDNGEITFRWKRPNVYAGNHMAIDDVSITPVTGNVFYSKSLGTLTSTSTWGTELNGSGTRPSSMTINNATFIYVNRSSNTNLPANWNLGSNSKLIVAEGTLTIPTSRGLAGKIDVMDNATLNIQNTNLPLLGFLADNSTVNISNTNATVPSLDYGNLIIGGGNKSIVADLKVKNKLTLNSKLNLGNNNLTMPEGATIQNASDSRYIIAKGNGRLKLKVKNNDQEVVFPVGTDTEYLPIRIKQNAAATTDVFSVKVIDGVYSAYNNNVPAGDPINEYAFGKTWIIDEEVVGGSDVSISFDVKTNLVSGLLNVVGALAGFDINEARIVHYENNRWDYSPGLPNVLNAITGGYTITRSGITSFSPYSMMSKVPTPLPVELVSFTAKREENGIVTAWKTAQELNNDFFTVERSTNGREFTEVGTVKGKGTTSQASAYTFTDQFAPSAKTYYRLKQTDFDGAFEYSKIVVVAEGKPSAAEIALYPNPSAGQAVLQTLTEITTPAAVTILNAQGQIVQTLEIIPSDLRTGVKLDLGAEPAGIYIVQIVAGNQVTNLRMVKQ